MSLTDKIKRACTAPQPLTIKRIIAAVVIALLADGLQIPLQAVPFIPEVIDVIAMAITTWLLGFHLLLLPTFAVEFIPVVDMLPTWTGCVLAVIALRKRGNSPPTAPPMIDASR
jgi:flagellar biosynthesis protein FliQ